MFSVNGTHFNILWIKINYCNGLGPNQKGISNVDNTTNDEKG